MLDQTAAPAASELPAVAPAPVLTAAQKQAQAIIDKQDHVAMLVSCLPTLKSEYLAGQFLMAEVTRAGDVQVKKRHFMKAAKRIVGGLPPFTEVALQLIAAKGAK